MAEIVGDCPRCRSGQVTFDVPHSHKIERIERRVVLEIYAICRRCHLGTVFIAEQRDWSIDIEQVLQKGFHSLSGNLNEFLGIVRPITLRDMTSVAPPEHLPRDIELAFKEGATCLGVGCFNAAATMFRLCVDHATKSLLPDTNVDNLNQSIRRSLGLRLVWLFNTSRLPEAFRDLSKAIKEDGNDGAHAGTLTQADAEDLLDFTVALLERLYTEPERIRLAEQRRQARRGDT